MKILIRNGQIYDVKKGLFIEADILIEDKKIKKIEKDLDVRESLKLIDADGKKVFPGFIDAHSHIGMWTDTTNGNDANECTHPITPHMRAIDGVNPRDKSFNEIKSAGFTTVMVTPGSGNLIAGQASILKTHGNTIKDMLVKDYSALKLAFGENPKSVYGPREQSPSSRMAISGMIREEFKKAVLYIEMMEKEKTSKDIYWEIYRPVIEKQIPLKIHAHRGDDILSAIRICEEFGFRYTLDHFTEGHLIFDEIKNKDIPVLLGPPFMVKSKRELINGSSEAVRVLNEKGFKISMTSDHPFSNARYLSSFLGLMVKDGLDYNEAIKMLTINPAKAMDIENRIGSIECGKDADLVIYNGDPLEIRTNVVTTIINGEIAYSRN
ncbi:amidohydrolase [Tissierella creatinophila]|uniref:Dihydroorotase n=1 Tax=Tissierella creatinophila DSM 6911 TaxID=1123403 RepID=A0A1U7M780_TISCR|nr:amidohydrolase [Tissierella creatinophila]OLS03110.1 dihydroorotase [Tissierella creatinophila DSM 6911]